MTRRFAYDESREPPAPAVPLLVAAPGSADTVAVSSLVDTGADCTLLPAEIAHRLRLPLVDRVQVEGLGGAVRRAPVHAAVVTIAGLRVMARVVVFDAEAVVGRDLLNGLNVVLDGPRRRLSIR